jgi:hypothetical protein
MTNNNQQTQTEPNREQTGVGGVLLAQRRALIVVWHRHERAAMCALLTGWGCDVRAASRAAETEPKWAPDFVIVGTAEQTEAAGVAELSAVRMRYGSTVPAIVICDAHLAPMTSRATCEYVVLEPMFASQRLRETLASLLQHARGNPERRPIGT